MVMEVQGGSKVGEAVSAPSGGHNRQAARKTLASSVVVVLRLSLVVLSRDKSDCLDHTHTTPQLYNTHTRTGKMEHWTRPTDTEYVASAQE